MKGSFNPGTPSTRRLGKAQAGPTGILAGSMGSRAAVVLRSISYSRTMGKFAMAVRRRLRATKRIPFPSFWGGGLPFKRQ